MHVYLNHLSRVPLPCPLLGMSFSFSGCLHDLHHHPGCAETFLRHNHIEDHLQNDHADLLVEDQFMVAPTSLKPTYFPQMKITKSTLRAIPAVSLSLSAVLPLPITLPTTRTGPQPRLQQDLQWGYWGVPDTQEGSNPESESFLAPDHPSNSMVFSDFIIRPKPPCSANALLSRPRSLPNKPQNAPPIPPPTIGYEAFRAHLPDESEDIPS